MKLSFELDTEKVKEWARNIASKTKQIYLPYIHESLENSFSSKHLVKPFYIVAAFSIIATPISNLINSKSCVIRRGYVLGGAIGKLPSGLRPLCGREREEIARNTTSLWAREIYYSDQVSVEILENIHNKDWRPFFEPDDFRKIFVKGKESLNYIQIPYGNGLVTAVGRYDVKGDYVQMPQW